MDWDQAVMNAPDWRDHIAFNRACDAAFAQLRRVTPLQPFTADVPSVVCVVRNEELRLPRIFDHYRRIGVRCFHIVDNASTDRTPDICAAADVTLWHTEASYAEAAYGQLWTAAIARRHGLGHWLFNVDADEFFVYSGMDRHGVGDLQDWLTARGHRRVFAPMIDMYGSKLYGGQLVPDPRPLWCQTPFFVGGDYRGRRSYRFENTPYGPLLTGGPRSRLVAPAEPRRFFLSKFPLSLWADDTAYANPHFPYPFADNPAVAYGALLHFKFLHDFPERVRTAVAEAQHWREAAEYRRYAAWIERGGGHAKFFSTRYSRVYRGPESLVAAGLMEPISWRADAAPPRASDGAPRVAPLPQPLNEDRNGSLHGPVGALAAAETRCDHRIEARRAILQFIPPGSVGAELGVFTGLFSEYILRNAAPRMLHLVDPWWKAYGELFPDWGQYTDYGRLPTRVAYEAAVARTEAARGDCIVQCHVAFSRDWLAEQEDESLDWVYLDSTHDYEQTIEELRLIRRKLRGGGYILGDDWAPGADEMHHRLFRAVHDYLRSDPEIELVYAGLDYQYALRKKTHRVEPRPIPAAERSDPNRDSRCFALAASADNDAYIEKGVLVAIRSIRRTNPGVPIVVLHSGFTERQKRMFDAVTFIQVPNEGFVRSDAFKADRPDVPDATFFHLSIERIADYDTVLYVDGDSVVLDNVDELFAMDVPFAGRLMHEYPLSGEFEDGEKLLASEGIADDFALNAGVMRYDLRYWRRVGLTQEALKLGKRHGWNAFKYVDQALLNLVVRKQNVMTPISRLYNFCRWPDMLRLEHRLVVNDLGLKAPLVAEGVAKILHWTGPIKPWHPEAREPELAASFCLECYEQFL
jgi:lipopolysaccharide biosynthesis glycosyltransferase